MKYKVWLEAGQWVVGEWETRTVLVRCASYSEALQLSKDMNFKVLKGEL